MRSSSDQYLAKVDHLRAFAVFQVFVFHFVHNSIHCPSICGDTFYSAPIPPFVLLEQGYSGVALFMCLSGYIFAYLTDGFAVHPLGFLWNRILRLMPLILFWSAIIAFFYSFSPITGTWSVIVEMEFYAVLPIIIVYLRAYGPKTLVILLLTLIAYRFEEWHRTGNVLELSYYTIMGRGDQILLGMIAFYLERRMKKTAQAGRVFAALGGIGLIGLCAFYYYFCLHGSLYHYPATGMAWVVMPTIDGTCFSCMMLYYLQLNIPSRLNTMLSHIGSWSYSIYLNHFFLVPLIFLSIATRIDMPAGFYGRLLLAGFVAFPIVAGFSALTYRVIEKPFLHFRRNYLMPLKT